MWDNWLFVPIVMAVLVPILAMICIVAQRSYEEDICTRGVQVGEKRHWPGQNSPRNSIQEQYLEHCNGTDDNQINLTFFCTSTGWSREDSLVAKEKCDILASSIQSSMNWNC